MKHFIDRSIDATPWKPHPRLRLIIRSRQLPSINHPRKSFPRNPIQITLPHTRILPRFPSPTCVTSSTRYYETWPETRARWTKLTSAGNLHFSRGNGAVVHVVPLLPPPLSLYNRSDETEKYGCSARKGVEKRCDIEKAVEERAKRREREREIWSATW